MPVDVIPEGKFLTQEIKVMKANNIAFILMAKGGLRALNLGKQRIAEALKVTLTKASRIIANTDQPDAPQLAIIAQVLDVTTDQLIKLEE